MSRQSRQKAQALVKNGLVKVNWKAIEDPSYQVAEGDMLSIRGFGRCSLAKVDGKTKKTNGKLHLNGKNESFFQFFLHLCRICFIM